MIPLRDLNEIVLSLIAIASRSKGPNDLGFWGVTFVLFGFVTVSPIIFLF